MHPIQESMPESVGSTDHQGKRVIKPHLSFKNLLALHYIIDLIPPILHDRAMQHLSILVDRELYRGFLEVKYRDQKKVETVSTSSDPISSLLWLTDSSSRFRLFFLLHHLLNDKFYWMGLRCAYTGADWLDLVPTRVLKKVFRSTREGRDFLMNDEEQQCLSQLPEEVTIYRGMTKIERRSRRYRVSWTLSREIAEFYAFAYKRHATYAMHPKVVHQLVVPSKSLLAYLNGRKESEVIYCG